MHKATPLRLSSWLRASLQGTTFLGVTMIVLIWTATAIYLRSVKQDDLQSAAQESSNLARAFEEHITRTIRGIDNTLIILRSMYEADNKSFGFVDWASGSHLTKNAVLQYSVVDGAGKMIESSRNSVNPLDFSDHEHFRFQKFNINDELFIGKPVGGIRSGNTSIHLTRRLRGWDGSFAGAIVASLPTEQLIKFYQTFDIGREGAISLIGLDGYARARRGFKDEDVVNLPADRGVLRQLEKSPVGTYDGKFGGVLRLISYRKVADYPLAVVVGLARHEVLANYYAYQWRYYGFAAGITVLILIVMALSIVHRRRLSLAYEKLQKGESFLRESRLALTTTLNNIDQGILMVDAKGSIGVINRRFVELLDLPSDWLTRKATMQAMLSFLMDRGEYGDNGQFLDRRVWDIIRNGGMSNEVLSYERTRPDGRILEIHARPLPDGGTVRTFTDITERKRAELKIAKLATHDDLTGLANRKLFRDQIHQALGRSQRYGESFAILLLDLDRFKDINDTRGHPAGDAVLRETAHRLSSCVRQEDTVARLGGDEFVILQVGTRTDGEAAQLAERIIETMRVPFRIDGDPVALATSIGIALAPRDGADYDQIIKKADEALYRAKDAGGNLFCFHGSGFMSPGKARERVDLVRAVS